MEIIYDEKDLVRTYYDIEGNYENLSLEASFAYNYDKDETILLAREVNHTHPSYEMFYILSNEVDIYLENGETIHLCKGDVALIPPNLPHYTSVINRGEYRPVFQCELHFEENGFKTKRDLTTELTSAFSDTTVTVYRRSSYNHSTFEKHILSFEKLSVEGSRGESFASLCSALEVLLHSSRRPGQGKEKKLPSTKTIVRKVGYLIACCYMYDLRLDDLAKRFYLSSRQFNRILTESMGDTFHVLLTRRRMQIATALLRRSDLSIAKIAEMVGYASSSGFHKVFKYHYHMLPGEYRERLAEKSSQKKAEEETKK